VVTATAKRRKGYAHDLEVEGHRLVSDEPVEAGGADEGPSPTRLLAASLAACTAITVEMYAARKEWEIGAMEVDVDVEYDGPVPSSFTVTLHLAGGLTEEQLERLRVIAGKCPVHKALSSQTPVSIEDRVAPLE
jgi:putative redox protein